MFRKIIFATIAALGTMAGTAQADLLTGVFNVNIYTYDAGGLAANANATAANVAAQTETANVTYTGTLDFSTTGANTTTVADFLNSGTGSFVLGSGSVTGLMTAGSFGTTTLFDFTGNFSGTFGGNILHDDGISLFDDGVLVTDTNAARPTGNGNTAYLFDGGAFRLIYSAANGNPEFLTVNVNSGDINVPLPAAAWLFGSALFGLAGIARRKKA